jgi:hypothetical protein
MPKSWASALSCAAWLVSSAALAQPAPAASIKDAPSTTVSPVTVEASTPKVIRKQAYSFVQSYAATPNPNIDQISRWHDPVCVQVWGLPLAAQAAKIKARIETMAQAVGLPPVRPGCKINVEIVFTAQPQAMMDTIAQRWEPVLGYYHRDKTAQLKTVAYPIQAWYVTGTESEGVNIGALISSGIPPDSYLRSPRVVDDPEQHPPMGCVDRFTACYKSEFGNVLIVADSKALDGKTLRLIADDMVMLALSQPKSLDGCNALPSVIDAFAKSPCPGRDAPRGLTPADAAYLKALYSADPEGKKFVEQVAIGERMANILIKGDPIAAAGAGSTGSPPADAKVR